ncbi:MAG TPA: ATP-binding protein [Alphaproteobacteria bacterium]|nr:ATP-binding protein [Alphaproteobacteria bacterium]
MNLRELAVYVPPVAAEMRCAEVYELFAGDADLITLAVLRNGSPVGLINRHELLTQLSHQFGNSLHARKPISALMDAEPLVVDVHTDLHALGRQITSEKPSALLKGFIVTERGRYHGLGTGLQLLQATSEILGARTRELEQARQQLEHANEAKSQFLANMSHELRTPLNAVIGFSELIRDEAFGPLSNARYREYACDIHDSGTHLLRLINDVLDMAKFEAGELELQASRVGLEETIARTIRLTGPRARRGRVSVETRLPAVLPVLLVVDLKLQQVMLNLLSNAVKFTPEGGHVIVAARLAADGGLAVSVSDTGVGIPPDMLGEVLKPFRQVADHTSRRHDGTGLGLPLAKSLIELHGGRLTLESELGTGTKVTVWLPPERLELPALLATAGPPERPENCAARLS